MAGRKWAITIGINEYQNLVSLQYAQNDAQAMRDCFLHDLGFEQVYYFGADAEGIPDGSGREFNARPSRASLLRFLRVKFNKPAEDRRPVLCSEDQLWFFFAGHGTHYHGQDYLAPPEVDPGNVAETAISLNVVTRYLRASGAGTIILLLDACRSESRAGDEGIDTRSYEGVITFYACESRQKSYEISELEHGSFTDVLLTDFCKGNTSKVITVRDLNQYLRQEVPKLNKHHHRPAQWPTTKTEALEQGDNILFRDRADYVNKQSITRKPTSSKAENSQPESLPSSDQNPPQAAYSVSRSAASADKLIPEAQRASVADEPSSKSIYKPIISPQQISSLSKISRRQLLYISIGGGTAIGTVILASKVTDLFNNSSSIPAPVINNNTLPGEEFSFETVRINNTGKVIEKTAHTARSITEDLGNGLILEMVEIPGGTFWMGAAEGEADSQDTETANERPQHQVSVKTFYMGKYLVTQAQYRLIMGYNPSYFADRSQCPVERVSWYDAKDFCQRLSELTGKTFRLPSESEWEYACRAGTTTPFHFGDTITPETANYNWEFPYPYERTNIPRIENQSGTTNAGFFPPNAFGLYDMHGNVREWCEDYYNENYNNAPTDGSAWLVDINNRNKRVRRGGSYRYAATFCRSADRGYADPKSEDGEPHVGFRVCYSL